MSLFDLDEPEPEAATQPAATAYKTLDDVAHHYRLVTSPLEVATLVSELQAEPRVAVSLLGTGSSAMQLKILGIALCGKVHEAAYIPCEGKSDVLKAIAPLFNGETCVVSSDIKRLIVVLHQHGISFNAPYYDTAVAHYLLQPERGHSIAEVAYELLHYTAITPDSLLGPKGRNQLKPQQLAPEALARWACEAADLTLQLPDALNVLLNLVL